MPARRTTSDSTLEPRMTGCTPLRLPLRLPIGVRTALTITTSRATIFLLILSGPREEPASSLYALDRVLRARFTVASATFAEQPRRVLARVRLAFRLDHRIAAAHGDGSAAEDDDQRQHGAEHGEKKRFHKTLPRAVPPYRGEYTCRRAYTQRPAACDSFNATGCVVGRQEAAWRALSRWARPFRLTGSTPPPRATCSSAPLRRV